MADEGLGLARLHRGFGAAVDAVTLAVLTTYPFFTTAGEATITSPVYALVVAAGAVAALALAGVSWQRPDRTPDELRTAAMVTTVVGAIAASGGADSELHHVLVLPLLLGALVHRQRALVVVVGYALVLLTVVYVVDGAVPSLARTLLRGATIGGGVLVTSWLAGAHRAQLRVAERARTRADQQAGALAELSRATGTVHELDQTNALQAIVATVRRLGHDGAAFLVPSGNQALLAEASGTLRFEPDDELRDTVRRAMRERTTCTIERGADHRVLVTPVLLGDRAVGAIAAESIGTQDGAAELEILAGQAATALDNADRYRSNAEMLAQLRDMERVRHDLVSTASHELRTPATVIRGGAELLDQRWDAMADEQRRELVGRINHHAGALQHVLDQLTTFLEIEAAGPREGRGDEVLLRDVVERALARQEGALAGHHVVVEVEDVRAEVHVDALERALSALLHNVAIHTPQGTTAVVRLTATPDELRLLVSDDGPGASGAVLDDLRAPFARAGDVLTRTTRGLGLGLTFVDLAARAHGGSVELEGHDGFTALLVLPLHAGADCPTGDVPIVAPQGPNVLVVEDDESLRVLARTVLEGAGCRVETAADGRTAISAARARPPDVVVLDVALPGLDGREVARLLREDDATAHVRIVVVTGSADRRELWSIWASGADALLLKPYEVEQLAETVLTAASGEVQRPRVPLGQPGRNLA